MKKIFAIFSVILTFGLGLPNDGWGAKNCKKFSCRHSSIGINTEYVYAYSYDKTWCFSCDSDDDGIDDDQCGYDDVVFQINEAGRATNLFKCTDKTGTTEDPWVSANVTDLCSCSDLVAGANVANSDTFYSDGDCGAFSEPGYAHGATKWCRYYKCKTGFAPSSDKKSCVVAPDKSDCDSSNGQWDATNSKCLCGTDDRTDGYGAGQTYEVPRAKCKCSEPSHSWDGKKCADPNAEVAEACDKSGGNWDPTANPKCKCDKDKGLDGPNSEGKCFCSNSAQVYDPVNKVCTDAPETVCKNTGGKWDGTKNTCDCNISDKNIKEKEDSKPTRCECKSEDYDWIGGTESEKGCELTPDAKKRQKDFDGLKKDCEAWKGKWSPETWEFPDGANPDTWECKCPSVPGVVQANNVSCKCDTINGYQQTAPNTCKLTTCTELKTKCDNLSDAEYKTLTAHGGQEYCECVCNDSNKAYIYSTNKCEAITNICDLIDGAIRDQSGKCICLSNLNPPVKGKCPSATNSGNASGGGASSPGSPDPTKITQAKEKVSNAYNALEKIEFEKSHWKTASGNFNGARLASDSIAGVVLGTVGGVVTSNVIKKNQVKGGFEKLQCTVGGQMVADFGDQFQVGIR
ncbi:MAG: hypothetical protein ACI4NZ_02985 [Candidatus Enterousia sp.]